MQHTPEFPTIFPVTSHTDHVGAGSIFVAVKGNKEDGIAYIPLALEKGAVRIVVDSSAVIPEKVQQLIEEKKAELIPIDNTRRALAQLSAQALNYPAKKLKLIAITGTKGKTTTTFLVEHILRTAGYKTALLSSVKNVLNGIEYPTALTTQQPDYLHVFFDICVKQSIEYVVMEVSAQAVSLNRVHGLEWDGFIWTNFSMEHGEFYPTKEDYFNDKCSLLNYMKKGAPVIFNRDDLYYALMSNNIISDAFSFKNFPATYQASLLNNDKNGISIGFQYDNQIQKYECPTLIGKYNAYNCAGVISLALKLNIDPEFIKKALLTFNGVPGRLERYMLPNGALCIIDLANNPAAFEALLPTLKKMFNHLIVVFGCGGDRDAARRPIMGEIAARYADHIILTTDNPRSENPQDIIEQIITGIPQTQRSHIMCELDRQKAINIAYQLSSSQTVVALLGKGAEQYQLAKGVKTYFSEREIVKSL